jgi:dCMP deaminase
MATAMSVASRSNDQSKKNGAVLCFDDGEPVQCTQAWNQFPNGVIDLAERWERPLKYRFVEHAERGSIYQAAKHGFRTDGLTLVCPWAACTDCARAIIQSGLVRLVTLPRVPNERWDEDIALADTMLTEAGVLIEFADPLVSFAEPEES